MSDDTAGPWPIDELAHLAGTTTRNVRLYQTRGLLPPPERKGRVGLYGREHLDRLRLVLTLLGRGYPLAAIRELVDAWEDNRSLSDVLGFEEALAVPFDVEPSARYTVEELQRLFPSDDGEGLARAIEIGILVPEGDELTAPIPSLVAVGAQLVAEGVPLADVLDASAAIQKASDHLADVFVRLFLDSVWQPFVDAGKPAHGWQEMTETLNRLRAVWPRAVVPSLAHAVQTKVDEAANAIASQEVKDAARSEATAS